jgi:hypothetical protein
MAMILTTKLSGGAEQPDAPPGAEALVVAAIARMVSQGDARMIALESGARQLHLSTGEAFHLGPTSVTRIA